MPNVNQMARFTRDAREVLSFAQEEAERLQHSYIGPEHLLLGLMHDADGMGGRVLRDLGLDLRRVEERVERTTRAGQRDPQSRLDLTADTKKVLELAVDEARRLGHHAIGTEHLLLGLVRSNDGVAVDVLKQLNIVPEVIRRQVRHVMQEKAAPRVNPGEAAALAQAATNQLVRHPRDVASAGGLLALITPIFGFAQEQAAKSQQHLNRWHVLLALMRRDSVAGFMLREMGLAEAPVEALAKEESSRNPQPGMEPSAQFEPLIEFIVRTLWPRPNRLLGSQYLLLGLLHLHADMFKQIGLDPEEVRARIERLW